MNLSASIKDQYEVNKTIIFSTNHLEHDTLIAINDFMDDLVYCDWANQLSFYPKSEFGFFIVVSDAELIEGTPKEIVDILTIGQQLGCYYVEFDCDGPEYDHLPTFDHSVATVEMAVVFTDMDFYPDYPTTNTVMFSIDVDPPNE